MSEKRSNKTWVIALVIGLVGLGCFIAVAGAKMSVRLEQQDAIEKENRNKAEKIQRKEIEELMGIMTEATKNSAEAFGKSTKRLGEK